MTAVTAKLVSVNCGWIASACFLTARVLAKWFHPTCITVRGGLPPAEEIDGFDELDAEAQETLKVKRF